MHILDFCQEERPPGPDKKRKEYWQLLSKVTEKGETPKKNQNQKQRESLKWSVPSGGPDMGGRDFPKSIKGEEGEPGWPLGLVLKTPNERTLGWGGFGMDMEGDTPNLTGIRLSGRKVKQVKKEGARRTNRILDHNGV